MLLVALTLCARHVTATRASAFIMECLSPEELALIQSDPSDEAEKKRQYELVPRTLACVHAKQTLPERVITRLFGLYLFGFM